MDLLTRRIQQPIVIFIHYSLLLPGKVLNLRALSVQKKFRGNRGNKEGAKRGWYLLQKSGLGEVKEIRARRGTDMVSA